ncbi:hypothetical protein GCM10027413_32800 [Conyzicola nivalis]|uniref:Uncharacterized protein n=1 Tax=Conyzicola nivalis TaxID=1477021 RepID=A0A916SPL8_9MICO|nr:hypothetical protein [Conyzicola nivalis]GGB11056.1 hypothetical protein GCM10010979_26690 [Conyzicola nivalis]
MTPLSPMGDEPASVDRAEIAIGHPHTLGVEYADDETLVPDGTGMDVADFGEAPDVEMHDYEEPHTL